MADSQLVDIDVVQVAASASDGDIVSNYRGYTGGIHTGISDGRAFMQMTVWLTNQPESSEATERRDRL